MSKEVDQWNSIGGEVAFKPTQRCGFFPSLFNHMLIKSLLTVDSSGVSWNAGSDVHFMPWPVLNRDQQMQSQKYMNTRQKVNKISFSPIFVSLINCS